MRQHLTTLALMATLTACGGGGGNQAASDTSTSPAAVLQVQAVPSAIESSTSASTMAAKAVDLTDAIAILKMIVGLNVNSGGTALTAAQAYAADVDGNGKVELSDAISVLKRIVGLETASAKWLFLNGTSTVADKLNPGVPLGVSAAASNNTNVNIVAVLRGDVVSSSAYTYNWALTSKPTGSNATIADTSAANPSFKADVAGTYVATVTITDASNNVSTSSVVLTACNASSNSSSPFSSCSLNTNTDYVLTGVVAVGAPLPAVTVTITDANGIQTTTTTGEDGRYAITDPPGVTLKAPFKVTVRITLGTSEVILNSVVLSRASTANVTPVTTAISALLNASKSYDPLTLDVSQVTEASITAASEKMATALSNVMKASGVSKEKFNPIKDPFIANGEGIDSVMDRVSFNYTNTGVSLVNRFEAITDTTSTISKVTVNANATPGALPAGLEPPTAAAHAKFVQRIKDCFAIPAANRVAYTKEYLIKDIFTPNSLHAKCSTFVDLKYSYKSQGQNFGQKWLYFLSNTDLDSSTKVVLVPQYVVDRKGLNPAWTGDDQMAYVYNINLIDKNNISYTVPEVIAKVSGDLYLRGNQRKYDISIQPMISKLIDNNGTNNRIEGRLRIFFDPTLAPNPESKGESYYMFDETGPESQTTPWAKPSPQIYCAWITGPLLQNNEVHDVTNPKGGVLMVPPHSDLVTRRDYSAIKIKYPFDFDPINNITHRNLLFSDCKATYTSNSITEIASAETNNAFTIDAVKTNSSSTATFKVYSSLNAATAYPTSISRTSCSATLTATTVPGWCYSTKREDMVSTSLKTAFNARYKDPKDIQYTAYIFNDIATRMYDPRVPPPYSTLTNSNDFLATADIVHFRIVGEMPFLDKSSEDLTSAIYKGNTVFRGVGSSMVNTYLTANAASVSKSTKVVASWTIPDGAEGIDRLGIGGWFSKSDGSRIGAATFSDSYYLPRSLTSLNITLSEDWYGYDFATYSNNKYSSTAKNAYREIWVRSYDRTNRQIQTVEFASR
jgi:hypothetical protein